MSELTSKISALIKETDSSWTLIGKILCVVSGVSYVGLKAVGVEFGGSDWSPLILLGVGLACLAFGMKLEERREKLKHARETDARRSHREKPEPSKKDREFLEWFAKLSHPVSRADLGAVPFPGDFETEHETLAASSTVRRAEWWAGHGEVRREGDSFTLREAQPTDSTVFSK